MSLSKWIFAVLIAFLAFVAPLPADSAAAADCQFVLGFKAIKDTIPAQVGECLENEHHNPDNGDALQRSTGGLLVWRKSDNWTAFTDGYRTWVNGPFGLQQRLNTERFPWENDGQTVAPPPVTSQPPSSNPAPAQYTRDQFSSLVIRKTKAQLLQAVGPPDDTQSSSGSTTEYWYYDERTYDPITNKVDWSAQVIIERGIVQEVNY